MNHITLGIDPGLNGALVWLNADGTIADIADMPTLELSKGKGTTRRIDGHALADLVLTNRPSIAWVEEVTSSPQMGVTSAFNMGYGLGIVHGVLASAQVPTHLVRPQVWKRSVGIPVGAGKDDSRAFAKRIWPDRSEAFKRVKDDGRAEAALIGLYGQTIGAARGAA